MVHLGKHGNLEWLPGKNLGMSASCGTDAAIGSLPLIYPFLVNDPGEGTQAKRRAHATIVDHLIPPMARAESYGDIARLEQLLDEYGNVLAMDPAKLPALRGEIWTLIQAAQLEHDLGLDGAPDDEAFDEFVLHVDGWLCEIKDVQIRDGLHVLGRPPEGDELVSLVLAILRANQMFGGQVSGVPGLRAALGLADGAPMHEVDRVEALARPWSRRSPRRAGTPPRCRRSVEQVVGLSDNPGGVAPPGVRLPGGGAAAAGDHRRDHRDPARPGRRLRTGRSVRFAAPRPGQRAAHRAQLLLRRPQGHPVAAGLPDRPGHGRVAAAAASRGDRGRIRRRSASRCGAPRPCGPAATTSARCWPCSA